MNKRVVYFLEDVFGEKAEFEIVEAMDSEGKNLNCVHCFLGDEELVFESVADLSKQLRWLADQLEKEEAKPKEKNEANS